MRKYWNVADDYRIYSVSSTATITTLRKLIETAYSDANLKGVLEVKLTPDASLVLTDMVTEDTITIAADATHTISAENAVDEFQLTNSAVVKVEVYRAD